MYTAISSYRANVDEVVNYGNGIMKDGTIDNESMPTIRSDIRTLESTWEYLREKCTAVQLRYIPSSLCVRAVWRGITRVAFFCFSRSIYSSYLTGNRVLRVITCTKALAQ